MTARVEVRGVRKAFGGTAALAGVDLAAAPGEIHALIGENGAGKSTLLKILAGAITPDAGTLALDGAPYRPKTPLDARRAGVATVHQELSLCPDLTVAENILLGVEPTRFGFLRRRESERIVTAALAPISTSIDPHARIAELPPAARQLVEIARALTPSDQNRCRLLILDEPTSSLAADDAKRLFAVMRALAQKGITLLYVSHFLEEVSAVADSFTVLRDGRTVDAGRMVDRTIPEIVHAMAGRQIDALFPRSPRTPGEVVLDLKDLAGELKPLNASLTLRRGEVLGIAGLMGAGRTELLRAIFGLDPIKRGTLRVLAHAGPASPAARLDQGVGFLSEDRKGEGLATALSIADNLTLSNLADLGPGGFILEARQHRAAQKWIDALQIRCAGPDQPVVDLSGGNQQKVALARLLHHDADLFLLDEPTRGVDVGSKAQIYEIIDRLACSGKAVLFVSSYLPELLGVCDSIAVMNRGRLGPARPANAWSEHELLLEATGSPEATPQVHA